MKNDNKQAGVELCQAQAKLNLSSLCSFLRSSLFLGLFQNDPNYCILVGYAYVLSFRPVPLHIRTIPVFGLGW